MPIKSLLLVLLASFFLACNSARQAKNPPATGFNEAASDARAMQIADEVMTALGGRKAWDDTRYLTWVFFGRRKHCWDKHTGDIRIESTGDSMVYLLNINTLQGKIWRKGKEETHPDTLQKYLERGKSIWINDAYWLVMPYKLKDSGVTLKYLGEQNTEAGIPADVLQLTFQNVGDTPENKYHVFVDKTSRLVVQWSYFKNAANEKPDFTSPWDDWKKYGNIMLSGGRGKGSLTEIGAPETMPTGMFTSLK